MSAAGAKRAKRQPGTDSGKRSAKGLWIDYSRLPNAKGFRQLPPELSNYNRYLELADLALGNPKGTPPIERRKNKFQPKVIERRSSC